MSQPLDLAVFVDALGWELAEEHRFLADVLPERHPLESVLGYSCACIPTILTGCRPEEHGHFSFFRYAPDASPFGVFPRLGALPERISGHGRFRSYLSRITQRVLGYTGYFQLYNVPFEHLPLFDYTEKRDLYRPGGISGGQPTIFDELAQAGVAHHVSDWRDGEETNVRAAHAAIASGEPRLVYLYLAGLDAVLHAGGTRSGAVGARLARYARWIRELVDAGTARGRAVRLHVFSDHGMADIVDHLDVMALLDRAGVRFGRDYVAMFDSTMARFWFLREAARETVRDALGGAAGGRILDEADLAAYGCRFANGRYGEMFFLAHPGTLVHPSFMGRTPLAGMHGYEPDHAVSRAAYLGSHAPARTPRGLWDLKSLLLDSLADRISLEVAA